MHPVAITTAKALASANTIEHYVGRQVAAAAAILLEALAERSDGALAPATRARGGDQLAALYGLRQFMVGTWDFDAIAREHGTAVLRETCGTDLDARRIGILVDEVLAILHKVVRTAAN